MSAALGINMMYFLSKKCYTEEFENCKRKKVKEIIDINYKICLFSSQKKDNFFY